MKEREKQILYTIINHYIKTGESVGSRTIEKKYDFGVSSATIRNVMADLEDMGLISKTHTSSGRVPTEEGYKIYIDELIDEKQNNLDDNIEYINIKNNQLSRIIKGINEMLAKLTKSTSIALEPGIEKHILKKVDIIPINLKKVFVVAITNLDIVKTAYVDLYNYTTEDVLKKASEHINECIDKNEYTLDNLRLFLERVGEIDDGFSSKNISNLYLSNESAMLLHSTDIMESIHFLEDKENIQIFLNSIVKDKKIIPYDVKVIFGKDLGIPALYNYVMMFSIYEYEGERGIISIIGPHRMDYRNNINLFNYINEVLKQSLNDPSMMKLLG